MFCLYRAEEIYSLCIHLNSLDLLQIGLKLREQKMSPGRFPDIGLLKVSEAFFFKVMKLTFQLSIVMDAFNNTQDPYGNKVQNSSTFPLSELNIIKYLRLELVLLLVIV